MVHNLVSIAGNVINIRNRCFVSSLILESYKNSDYNVQSNCYKVNCYQNDKNEYTFIEITIPSIHSGYYTIVNCSHHEQDIKKTVSGYDGYIVCPNIDRMCYQYQCNNRGYLLNSR